MCTLTNVVGVLAATFATVCLVPQAFRLLRSGFAGGVSFPASVLTVLSSAAWLAYSFAVRDLVQIVTNLLGTVVALLIVGALVRMGRSSRELAVSAAGSLVYAAGTAFAWLAGGLTGVSLVAVVTAFVRLAPMVHATFSRPDISGLSPATCVLNLLGSVTWLAYGALTHQPALIWPQIVFVIVNGAILLKRCPPALPVRRRSL